MDSLIVLVVLVVLVVVILINTVKIVPQARTANIERLGRYQRTAGAGLTLVIPFIDRMLPHMDMREQVVSFPPQPVITEDNLVVSIDTVVYFQVTDAKAATYEIANYIHAVEQLTTTTLRNVVGGMNLEEALTSRDTINNRLRGVLDEATGKWGLRVSRVELKAIDPPHSIQDSMEKQMRAERDRRAAILTAEGTKQSQILTAEGERQAQILAAEGEAQSRILRANAEAEAIDVLFHAIHAGGADNEVLAYQYLQQLPKLADGQSNTVFVIPSELSDALKGVGSLFESNRSPAAGTAARSAHDDAAARTHSPEAPGERPGRPDAAPATSSAGASEAPAADTSRAERRSRPTTAEGLRSTGVMESMTARAMTADEMRMTSLDEALAVPENLDLPVGEAADGAPAPGTRPAGRDEDEGNSVGQ
ncbi:SPFH domain-containing protein [uncultured Micrococcus sp.]|uniref:SPFH domain-containing protein n=1 Tax=uncultured Micrococcus sp. TaxID=114051 RepID=UPI00259606B8|nr:SPFH domain-containing protein [uncultured Micrococcus sp.]